MSTAEPAPRVTIDVWSDYVCPFCYLELPTLDALQRELGDRVVVTWRAFELRPDPVPTLEPAGEYLRSTWARAVYPMAAARGMVLRLPPVQPRSRLALEAAEHARGDGADAFARMHRALFAAFFEDGRDIGDPAVLVEVGAAAGLDVDALRDALATGRYRDAVLADERLAAELGLDGVPAQVVRRAGAPWSAARLVAGAQPIEALRAAVEQVTADAAPAARQTLRRRLPLADG